MVKELSPEFPARGVPVTFDLYPDWIVGQRKDGSWQAIALVVLATGTGFAFLLLTQEPGEAVQTKQCETQPDLMRAYQKLKSEFVEVEE